MSDVEAVKAGGYYRHFKGGLYYVLGVAVSSEDRQAFEVIYWSFEKQQWNRRPLRSLWTVPQRQKCGWLDDVDKPEYRGPRFTLVENAPVQPFEPNAPIGVRVLQTPPPGDTL